MDVVQTLESYPYNDWPSLTLTANGLTANSKPGATPTTAGPVTAGEEIVFTTARDAPAPSPDFCFEVRAPSLSPLPSFSDIPHYIYALHREGSGR